jgi:hypothetical protein
MKKLLIIGLLALVSTGANASHFFGKVSQVNINHQSVSFEMDTSAGFKNQTVCDFNIPLTFTIDLTKVGGPALLKTIQDKKASNESINVHGTNVCVLNQSEEVDSIVY